MLRHLKAIGGWIGVVRNYAIGVATVAAAVVWLAATTGLWAIVIVGAFLLGAIAGVGGATWKDRAGDYEIIMAKYEYSFDPEDLRNQTQVSTVTVKARRENVQLFRGRYSYTGSGSAKPELLTPACRLLAETSRESDWAYYYVLFPHPLAKGDTQEIKVRQRMVDNEEQFQPLLAKDVIEPLADLTLKVAFPADRLPYTVRAAELRRRRRDFEWVVDREFDVTLDARSHEVDRVCPGFG